MRANIKSVLFAGTPDFAAQSLAKLISTGLEVKAVLTQPDKPAGRGRKLTPSPVKQLATHHNIPTLQPEHLTDDFIQSHISTLQPDIMVVVAYGLIIPKYLLNLPHLGCVNVHASLLPRWRGAAPIQRAIEAGDPYTGVCIMQMDEGLDTGPVLSKAVTEINPEDTSTQLHDKLASIGADLLVDTLIHYQSRSTISQNNHEAKYAQKLQKSEGELDWNLPTQITARKIRAFNPWPVCFTQFKPAGEKDPIKLRIWSASIGKPAAGAKANAPGQLIAMSGATGIDIQTSDGLIRVTQAQLPGTKPMNIRELINGYGAKLSIGMQFGTST